MTAARCTQRHGFVSSTTKHDFFLVRAADRRDNDPYNGRSLEKGTDWMFDELISRTSLNGRALPTRFALLIVGPINSLEF